MHKQYTNSQGFTITELLIVIVVIAIIAAISIVAYTGIQDRAIASAVKSDLSSFSRKIELAKVNTTDGGYPSTLTADMGIKISKDMYVSGRFNWYYCLTPDHTKYSVGVISVKNRGYFQTSGGGIVEATGNVDSTSNCARIGTTPANSVALGTSSSGYQWSAGTGTGVWQAWAN